MRAVVSTNATTRCARRSRTCRRSSAAIRTGRATPGLVEKLKVDYYGTEVPLQQLAGFSVPEPRVLVISPYDKGAIKAIEKAIQASDLGINPATTGRSSGWCSRSSPRSAARSS